MQTSPRLLLLTKLPLAMGWICGLAERGDDLVPYNAAVHLEAGSVVHRHRKVYLPTYGMFDEGRFFGRGPGAARSGRAGALRLRRRVGASCCW